MNKFENAYFGKAYKTRDGRKAIFYMKTDFGASLLTEKYGLEHYHFDGVIFNSNCINEDDNIVSEWQEEINEKELHKLAYEYADYNAYEEENMGDVMNHYKAGYREAKKGGSNE